MAIEVFNRYEHKYLLDKEKFLKIIGILDERMEIDSHNINHTPYTISNIYYDTDDDYLIRSSISKPEYKEKLRLRAYGSPIDESEVFLEIKKKFKGIINKRRTALNLHEAYEFLNTKSITQIKEYMNRQVINEITYFLNLYDLKPKLYLAYDRIAYFEKDNHDLRISFDMNIRSRRYDLFLEKGDYGESLFDKEVYLMEVKTSLSKPLWLSHLLSETEVYRQSFSKYGTEYKNTIKERNTEKQWTTYSTTF